MPEGYYRVLRLRTSRTVCESIASRLFEEGCQGIEEVPEGDGENSLPTLKVYWRDENPSRIVALFERLRKLHPGEPFGFDPPERKPVEDWHGNWKKNHPAFPLGGSFFVRAPWQKARPGKRNLVIAPGRCFGTGLYASTELATVAMETARLRRPFRTLVDLGAGSGILTLVALRLEPAVAIHAFDLDEAFLEELPANLVHSGFAPDSVRFSTRPIREFEAKTQTLVANVTADVLIDLKTDFDRLLEDDGRLIASGIHDLALEAFERAFLGDYEVEAGFSKENWHAFTLTKKRTPRRENLRHP